MAQTATFLMLQAQGCYEIKAAGSSLYLGEIWGYDLPTKSP